MLIDQSNIKIIFMKVQFSTSFGVKTVKYLNSGIFILIIMILNILFIYVKTMGHRNAQIMISV